MIMGLFLRMYRHLLPRAKAWRLFPGTSIHKFFSGLAEYPATIREAIDRAYLDIFPDTTRELEKWETQFNLDARGTESDRRAVLLSAWRAVGGQGLDYLQSLIWDAGFTNVYIHEWWEPGGGVRDPYVYLADRSAVSCGGADAICGRSSARCGALQYKQKLLVNKGPTVATVNYKVNCGGADAICGRSSARCGIFDSVSFIPLEYNIPADPDAWPYIIYIGGENFPEIAEISSELRDEFERVLLKYFPYQQWIGLLIVYT